MKRSLARLRAYIAHAGQCSASGQCNRCGGIFPDWNGGTCDACKNLPNAT
ncbi:hypothetical protein ACIQVL_48895 [Streptomyces sp. NPDC090499]